MKTFLYHIAIALFRMGPWGLILLGVLDSSFLFMPLGNDLLVVALTARHHRLLPVYALFATAGSVAGCFLMDLVSRKGGEAGLKGRVPKKRLDYVKRKIEKEAGWTLGAAALMPPPFPFTVVVIAMAALQYPRKKLLATIAIFRFLRFSLIGLLAVFFGRHIIRLADTPAVEYTISGIIIVSVVGSIVSVVKWIRSSRKVERPA